MKQKLVSFILVVVMLLGLVPAGFVTVPQAQAAESQEASDTIKIDFKELAQELADQDWWQGLEMGSSADSIKPSTESNAQYAALLEYLSENKDWTINDTVSKVANPAQSAKKLFAVDILILAEGEGVPCHASETLKQYGGVGLRVFNSCFI